MILAGGKGSRLRPYTTILPKPLIPVGERPILQLILRQLARAGVERVDLCVGHLGELIRAYLAESDVVPPGLEIHYTWEPEPLGTAGALRLVEPATEPLLVMNGDVLTALDYAGFMAHHRTSGAKLTVATHPKEVPLSLGVIEQERGRVTDYVEKPTLEYAVSMGIYAYEPEVIAQIPDGRFDFPDLVLALLKSGEPVCTYPFDGAWHDIGTPDEHALAVAAYDARPESFDPA